MMEAWCESRELTLEQCLDLLGPVILNQLVGLIHDGEADTAERKGMRTAGNEVLETARGTDQHIAAVCKLGEVHRALWATVDRAEADRSAVSQSVQGLGDLDGEFARGDDNQDDWLRLNLVRLGVEVDRVGLLLQKLAVVGEDLGQDRQQVSSSLARAGLRNGHDVVALEGVRSDVSLDGHEVGPPKLLQVATQQRMKALVIGTGHQADLARILVGLNLDFDVVVDVLQSSC